MREGFREETQVEIFHQDEDVFFFFLYAPCICFCLQHVHVAQALLSKFSMTFRFSFVFLFSFSLSLSRDCSNCALTKEFSWKWPGIPYSNCFSKDQMGNLATPSSAALILIFISIIL